MWALSDEYSCLDFDGLVPHFFYSLVSFSLHHYFKWLSRLLFSSSRWFYTKPSHYRENTDDTHIGASFMLANLESLAHKQWWVGNFSDFQPVILVGPHYRLLLDPHQSLTGCHQYQPTKAFFCRIQEFDYLFMFISTTLDLDIEIVYSFYFQLS